MLLRLQGSWMWDISGRHMNYTNWNQYSPNNDGAGTGCLHMMAWNKGWVNHGEWDDITCRTTRRHIHYGSPMVALCHVKASA